MMLVGDQRQAGDGARWRRAGRTGGRRPGPARRLAADRDPTCSTCRASRPADSDDAHARDRLQLVERAARVAQPAAAHLGDPHAAGGQQRRQHQRRLVADPAGGVLVGHRPRPRHALARTQHRVQQRRASRRRSCRAARPPSGTPPAGRRARRARSSAAISSPVSSPPSRLRAIRSAMRAPRQITGVPGRSGSWLPGEVPLHGGADVGERVAVVAAADRRPAHARAPAAARARASGRWRRWSDRSRGRRSAPAGRRGAARPAAAAAPRRTRAAQSANPAGSLRWPQIMSVSTRLVNTRLAVRQIAQPRDRAGDALAVRLRRAPSCRRPGRRRCRRSCRPRAPPRRPARMRCRWFGARRQQREVVAAGRAQVRRPASPSNGRAITRPTACSPVSMLAGGAAGRVQLLQRHRLLVGRDLEHAVGRRVDDPVAGALVLLAQPLDDLGARGGHVADHAAAGAAREVRRAASAGKPSGKVGNGRSVTMPIISQCPVVVSMPEAALDQPAPHRRRIRAAAGSRPAAARCPAPAAAAPAARGRRPPRPRGPSVFDPAVPNASASGRSPTPTASSTITQARGIAGQSRP